MRDFSFGDILFLLQAAGWTLGLFAASVAGAAIVGVLIALLRISPFAPFQWVATIYMRVIQGTPVLMQLFLIFFGSDLFGFPLNAFFSAALALSLNGGAFFGEIWAVSMRSVPAGQWEAARTLGLSSVTTLSNIIMPQALRVAIPPTVGFLVQMMKGTAMGSFVGFVELSRASQLVNNATFEPFLVFGIASLIYFAICWPLSLLSGRLEAQLGQAYRR